MSVRAARYARASMKGSELGTPARLVMMLLADSCNHVTGQAFTGQWLADEAGIDMRHIRRYVHTLRDTGLMMVHERTGEASVVTFPTAAYLSTAPGETARGEHSYAPGEKGGAPLAKLPPIPRDTTRDFNSTELLEVVAREALCCDGTGYVYDESTRSVSPCPLHHPRRKAQ